jgi:hypothetical protein
MKQYTSYLAVVLFAILSIIYMVDYENQIESLKEQLQEKELEIDSLCNEIDTLQWESELWDYNISNNTTHLLSALIMVESRDNDSAHAVGEDAVGCLQIRKTMVDDVNRILKRQKKDLRFTYDDRWLRNKSIQMFDIYCKHYGLTTAEEIARCWNGGPRGMDKEATVYYWNKVQDHLDS